MFSRPANSTYFCMLSCDFVVLRCALFVFNSLFFLSFFFLHYSSLMSGETKWRKMQRVKPKKAILPLVSPAFLYVVSGTESLLLLVSPQLSCFLSCLVEKSSIVTVLGMTETGWYSEGGASPLSSLLQLPAVYQLILIAGKIHEHVPSPQSPKG